MQEKMKFKDKIKFCLMAKGGNTPSVMHHELPIATAEAERLCKKLKKEIFVFMCFNSVAYDAEKNVAVWNGRKIND